MQNKTINLFEMAFYLNAVKRIGRMSHDLIILISLTTSIHLCLSCRFLNAERPNFEVQAPPGSRDNSGSGIIRGPDGRWGGRRGFPWANCSRDTPALRASKLQSGQAGAVLFLARGRRCRCSLLGAARAGE